MATRAITLTPSITKSSACNLTLSVSRTVRGMWSHACCLRMIACVVLLFSALTSLAQVLPPGAGRYRASQSRSTNFTPIPPSALALSSTTGGNDVTASTPNPFSAEAGTSGASQRVTLTNSSSNTYLIQMVSKTGDGANDFQVTLCDSDVLKPKGNCKVVITYNPSAAGNSIATLQLSATSGSTVKTISVPLVGTATTGCAAPAVSHNWILPISRPGLTSDADINCFYGTTSNLAFATEAKYLYNPGSNANIIGGNLVSMQFPLGVQLSIVGNANSHSCSSSSPSTTSSGTNQTVTAPSTSSCATSSNGSPTTTLEQDVQTITQGGNFAIQGLWPVLNKQWKRAQLASVIYPKMGFEVSGLTAQTTTTGASNINGNISSETYFQLDAIPASAGGDSPGSIFVNYRGGWQGVSSEFQQSAGLPHSSFGLQMFSAGLAINGFMRISAQRYFGPEQTFVNTSGSTVTVNNFKNWQIAIQLTPSNVKNKNNPNNTH
jgi:hypothetical protein